MGSCSRYAYPSPPYEFISHVANDIDAYTDTTTGRLYLYKPGLGIFPAGNLTIYDTYPKE